MKLFLAYQKFLATADGAIKDDSMRPTMEDGDLIPILRYLLRGYKYKQTHPSLNRYYYYYQAAYLWRCAYAAHNLYITYVSSPLLF